MQYPMGLKDCLARRVFARFSCVLRGSLLALCAGGIFVSTPAQANEEDNATAQVGILTALSLIAEEDMDFGKIAPTPSGGTVVMTAVSAPSCTTTGGLIHTGACQTAKFAGYGVLNQIVRIKLPPAGRITLTGPGTSMLIDNLAIGAPGGLTYVGNGVGFVRYRISSTSGIFDFRIGGRLNVNASQAGGIYQGQLDVRIEYN